MQYGNNFSNPQPTNNLWFGNNYSSGYSQTSRSGYPMNTMPTPSPISMQQPMPQYQTINNILEVMGSESASAFQMGPNSRVILMDANRQVFYIKRSDDSGYSETKAYAYHEIPLHENQEFDVNKPDIDPNDYVTKKEFNEYKDLIEEMVTKNE